MSSYWKDNFEFCEDLECEVCGVMGGYDHLSGIKCGQCLEEEAMDRALEDWAHRRIQNWTSKGS